MASAVRKVSINPVSTVDSKPLKESDKPPPNKLIYVYQRASWVGFCWLTIALWGLWLLFGLGAILLSVNKFLELSNFVAVIPEIVEPHKAMMTFFRAKARWIAALIVLFFLFSSVIFILPMLGH